MDSKKIKTFYRRKLPHIQSLGEAFFVTFRLRDSLPKRKLIVLRQNFENNLQLCKNIPEIKKRNIAKYQIRKDYFTSYDLLLDKIENGPIHLANPKVANAVKDELHRHDGQFYELIAYTIMSNHVHILIDTAIQLPDEVEDFEQLENIVLLDKIMKRIKGPTAVYANRILGRNGQFWERESFDIYVRNSKMFDDIIDYILNNPVKARIVKNWENYNWSYLKPIQSI